MGRLHGPEGKIKSRRHCRPNSRNCGPAFDRETKKYNIYPLDASFAERADVSIRPSLTRGRSTFTYYPGVVRVPEGAAPDTKNKDYIVTAEVEIPAGGADGVLVTQGGRFGGWGLLILDGKLQFDYAFSNQPQHKYRVVSYENLAAGKHTIKYDFKYDGPGYGKSGTGTLSVDGKEVAQGKIERTISVRFSLDETMEVGEDTGTPVVGTKTSLKQKRVPVDAGGKKGRPRFNISHDCRPCSYVEADLRSIVLEQDRLTIGRRCRLRARTPAPKRT